LAKIFSEASILFVELDNVEEERFCIRFEPCQAYMVISSDCYTRPLGYKISSNNVFEVMIWEGEHLKSSSLDLEANEKAIEVYVEKNEWCIVYFRHKKRVNLVRLCQVAYR